MLMFVLWSKIWSFLVNIPCALDKNCVFCHRWLECTMMPIRSCWFMVLLSSSLSLVISCLVVSQLLKEQCWSLWPYVYFSFNHVGFYLRYLNLLFDASHCYIFLVNWLSYHCVLFFFSLAISFAQVYIVWYEHPPSVFYIYFSYFYISTTYITVFEVSFL